MDLAFFYFFYLDLVEGLTMRREGMNGSLARQCRNKAKYIFLAQPINKHGKFVCSTASVGMYVRFGLAYDTYIIITYHIAHALTKNSFRIKISDS